MTPLAIFGINRMELTWQRKKKSNSNTIALNKKARHNYTLTDKFEAGMSLQGWEIKSHPKW